MLRFLRSRKIFKNSAPSVDVSTTNKPRMSKPNQEIEFERQRKLVDMQKTLEELKEVLEENQKRTEEKQELIKGLIKDGRKTEAREQLIVLKTLQDVAAKQADLCNSLEKTKTELEASSDASTLMELLQSAASMQKEVERKKGSLEDYNIEKREIDERHMDIEKLMRQITEGNKEEEEIQKMYEQFEEEAYEDTVKKINRDPLRNIQIQRNEHMLNPMKLKNSSKDEVFTFQDLLAENFDHL